MASRDNGSGASGGSVHGGRTVVHLGIVNPYWGSSRVSTHAVLASRISLNVAKRSVEALRSACRPRPVYARGSAGYVASTADLAKGSCDTGDQPKSESLPESGTYLKSLERYSLDLRGKRGIRYCCRPSSPVLV